MEKETTFTSGQSLENKQREKNVRVTRTQRRESMSITIPMECKICGTQYDPKEHDECPHCVDNEFDPCSVFKDVELDY